MALGTTATIRARAGNRSEKEVHVDFLSFAGDGAYPTGGTAAFKAYVQNQTGKAIDQVLGVIPQSCGDNKPEYDIANDKLFVRVISTAAEVANATNLSAVTFNLIVLWR